MTYQKALKGYVQVEQTAHIFNSSSIVNKVTQEILELKKWKRNNDLENVKEETRDAVVNILSAVKKTWVLPNEENLQRNLEVTGDHIDDAYSDWNEDIQWFNQDYSRRKVTPEMLQASTEWLLSTILSFGNSQETLEQILIHNTEKFRARIDKYRPNIDLKEYVATYPDFPKPWIIFRDISPLLRDKKIMEYITNELIAKTAHADVIAWLDARGFLFGMPVAMRTGKPFVMVRKKWKLPWEKISQSYQKEYWEDVIQIQEWAILPWQKVALIDDLLATWGTMNAAGQLIEKVGWEVEWMYNIIQLNDSFCASERERIWLQRYKIDSMIEYDE